MPAKKPAPKPRPVAVDNANNAQAMFRLPQELLDALDAWAERLNAGGTGPKWTRSDVVRAALARAVKERGESGGVP